LTWAEKKGIKYSTFSTHQVRLQDILEIAKENNITFQKGDILFVRIGVTKEWDTIMTDAEKRNYSDNPKPEHAGVEATKDVLRWLWDSGFAAIASDAISWEVRFDPFSGFQKVCGNFTGSHS
jgi:kynurenine formamidase